MTRFTLVLTSACVLAAYAASAACDDDDDDRGAGVAVDAGSGSTGANHDASTAADGGVQTEADILQVMLTANAGEVLHGNVAASRAQAGAVRDFASTMVGEHSAAGQRAAALAASMGVTPTASGTSARLEAEANAMKAALDAATPGAFDALYVDGQVTMHSEVLALVDDVLLPAATTTELVDELGTMRSAVAMHLAHAQQLAGAIDAGVLDAGQDAMP